MRSLFLRLRVAIMLIYLKVESWPVLSSRDFLPMIEQNPSILKREFALH